jgi:cell shape-determining protein MreD
VIRYSLSLILLILLAIVAQQFLPVFISLYNARLFLLLTVFLCASVTVPLPVMFFYALIGGFLWDAQCSLSAMKVDPYVYPDPVPSLRFGVSILLFGLTGLFMHGFRPLFLQGKWYLSACLTGAATFLFCAGEYLLIDFARGSFTFHSKVFLQCFYTALFSIVVSPLIFALLFQDAKWFHHAVIPGNKEKKMYLS